MNKIAVTTDEGITHTYEADARSVYEINDDGYLNVYAASCDATYPPGRWTFVAHAEEKADETKNAPEATNPEAPWSPPRIDAERISEALGKIGAATPGIRF